MVRNAHRLAEGASPRVVFSGGMTPGGCQSTSDPIGGSDPKQPDGGSQGGDSHRLGPFLEAGQLAQPLAAVFPGSVVELTGVSTWLDPALSLKVAWGTPLFRRTVSSV